MRRGRAGLALLFPLLLATPAVPAGAGAPAQEQALPDAASSRQNDSSATTRPSLFATAFGEAVEVREVMVDVCVRDRRERPVLDLAAQDFELRVDGLLRTPSYFAAPTAAASPPDREAATAAASERSLQVVIYLDQWDLRPGDRRRILDDLQGFAASRLAAGDRVMVATENAGVRVAQPFTRDPAAVRAALDREGDGTAMGLQNDLEARRALLGIAETHRTCSEIAPFCTPCVDVFGSMLSTAFDYADRRRGQVDETVAALERLLSALAAIDGPKLVVYVGSGMEQTPGAPLFVYLSELCPNQIQILTRDMPRYEQGTLFERLAARAREARTTFLTLDPTGLTSGSLSQVESSGAFYRATATVDFERRSSIQGALMQVARETGGRALVNLNDPAAALADAAAESAACYSLGFQPLPSPPGTVHRIDVAIPGRRGLTVAHRPSYRDTPREEIWAERLQGALFSILDDNPLEVRLEAGEAAEKAERKKAERRLPLTVHVPWERLTLLGEDSPQGLVRLLLAVPDGDGRSASVREQLFALVRDGEAGAGREKTFVVSVPVPRGEHVLAVAVRDELSGRSSFLSLPVSVD